MISRHFIITKFINKLQKHGKKQVSRRILFNVIHHLGGWANVQKAILKACPIIITKSTQIGGRAFLLPVPLTKSKQISTAISWIIKAARKRRSHKSISTAIVNELQDNSRGEGQAYQLKRDAYRTAINNRASLHFLDDASSSADFNEDLN
jgi:ribosomal protein S7